MHLDRDDISVPRAMSMVRFVEGRPAELLPVSVTILREFYDVLLQNYPSLVPTYLPRAAIYPSSADLMARRYGLAVLCPSFLNTFKSVMDANPEAISGDCRGTVRYLEMFTELTSLLTDTSFHSSTMASLARGKELVQQVIAMTQVHADLFAQRSKLPEGVADPYAPCVKDLSATFLPAPTLNGLLIAFNAHEAVHKELHNRCACCHEHLPMANSGEASQA